MLYEPTNIIPSTLTQTGTVAQIDNVNIQWQVNGNSAMTMFQIDVMQNDVDSTFVYSTGLVTQTPQPPTGSGQAYTALPFYGKDRFGEYVQFNYYPAADWGTGGQNSTNWGLIDGNEYKLQVTQFFNEVSQTFAITTSSNLTAGQSYYFSYSVGGSTIYISFSVTDVNLFQSGSRIYYSETNNRGWVRETSFNQRIEWNLTFARTTTAPSGATSLGNATAINSGDLFYNTSFVSQNGLSLIMARVFPTLTIETVPSTIPSSSWNFSAEYAQAQNDAISTVRWRLYNSTDLNDPIDDTGEINTAVLEYSYDGFFNEQSYRLYCDVVTENKVQITASVIFTVSYQQQIYTGDFSVKIIPTDNANFLEWDSVAAIPGTATPENGYSILNGEITVSSGTTIEWNSILNEEGEEGALTIATPWTAAWTGNITGYTDETLFELGDNLYSAKKNGNVIEVYSGNTLLGSVNLLEKTGSTVTKITVVMTPTAVYVYHFDGTTYLGVVYTSISYSQSNITSVKLIGAQSCDYMSVFEGDGQNILLNFSNPSFVPSWSATDYNVLLLANFIYGIDGGTGSATGNGFRIYKHLSGSASGVEVATLTASTTKLKDYAIRSHQSYIYEFYVYDSNGAFMGVRSNEDAPALQTFQKFSLLATEYNTSDLCYHVVKEYQFSCNIQDMSISNNSNKSYVQNFTPYPTVFQSTANYASGTLQALIGFVDMTAYKYWDDSTLMDELNGLSTSDYTMFLRDMKGHLWMVDVGTVTQTATQKTKEMQVTISLPWTEIGDASDVSIIQTPDDEGWDYDAQVLDVTLDVDINTGLLQVVYPFPYNGTAFYLVGVTPTGTISAVQPLSSTASTATDGQLKAVVRHK